MVPPAGDTLEIVLGKSEARATESVDMTIIGLVEKRLAIGSDTVRMTRAMNRAADNVFVSIALLSEDEEDSDSSGSVVLPFAGVGSLLLLDSDCGSEGQRLKRYAK
eukprot:gene4525-biopygen2147